MTEAARVDFANAISTTKYTWYSWLPKSIWEQFRRIANIYFLLISVLMVSFPLWKLLSLVGKVSSLLWLQNTAYRNVRDIYFRVAFEPLQYDRHIGVRVVGDVDQRGCGGFEACTFG